MLSESAIGIRVALFEGRVADNIRYGTVLRGKKFSGKKQVQYLGSEDLDSSLAAGSASGLSVKEAQRVSVARALANDPEKYVLLLDEPRSALDPISTEYIEESIGKLMRDKGMPIIMVSHSIKQIQRIIDLVFVLVDG